MNMQMLTRGFLVFELTGSYAPSARSRSCTAVSMLIFSLYGGVLADGRSKRMILQLGQIAAAINAAAVATLLFADLLRWEHLLIAAFAQGVTSGLMMPARQAMPPEIVEHSLLQNAVSLNTANMNVMRLLGPALAGVLLAVTEAEWVYTIMTALFVISIVLLARVPKRAPRPRSMSAANVIRELREGFTYIRRTPTVFSLLAIGFTTSLLGMPYIRLMPGFVADVLKRRLGAARHPDESRGPRIADRRARARLPAVEAARQAAAAEHGGHGHRPDGVLRILDLRALDRPDVHRRRGRGGAAGAQRGADPPVRGGRLPGPA